MADYVVSEVYEIRGNHGWRVRANLLKVSKMKHLEAVRRRFIHTS